MGDFKATQHLPWVVPLALAVVAAAVLIESELIPDGENRLNKLEHQIENIRAFCCEELDGVGRK